MTYVNPSILAIYNDICHNLSILETSVWNMSLFRSFPVKGQSGLWDWFLFHLFLPFLSRGKPSFTSEFCISKRGLSLSGKVCQELIQGVFCSMLPITNTLLLYLSCLSSHSRNSDDRSSSVPFLRLYLLVWILSLLPNYLEIRYWCI